jgi:6-pyruvoyltetrahydropterin/6-carboxytetrahydropterin synthase
VATLSLTRRVSFSAVHRYRRPDWSDAQNAAAFGGAAGGEYHGHDYVCGVTVTGPMDEATGMIVDLRLLDDVLHTEIVGRFAGRNLNVDVPDFRDGKVPPTGENLARLIAGAVQAALLKGGARAAVTEVTVAEDPSLSATWRATDR